jgi:hypothetical protein
LALLTRDVGHDCGGDQSGIGADPGDQFGVPEMMKATGAESLGSDAFPISTGIKIVGGMKRLVKVTNQMQDEFERDQPFLGIGFGVGKLGQELLNLVYYAGLGRAIRGDRAGGQ